MEVKKIIQRVIPRFRVSIVRNFILPRVLLIWIVLVLASLEYVIAHSIDYQLPQQGKKKEWGIIDSHSCIHDQIIQQRRRPGRHVYSVTPQVYEDSSIAEPPHRKRRALLGISESVEQATDGKTPIRIFLNYDAVGHSPDRDCRNVGDIVKLGEPLLTSVLGTPACNAHLDPPVLGDCWYNCTLDDISKDDKKHRLHKVLCFFSFLTFCNFCGAPYTFGKIKCVSVD